MAVGFRIPGLRLRRAARAALLAALMAGAVARPGAALDLTLPANATLTREQVSPATSHAMPVGSWQDGGMEVRRLQGRVTQQAWRLVTEGRTTLQILAPLRQALKTQGFEILFACEDEGCGGFDFRYNMPVLPAPDMFVDLFAFRYLAARRPAAAGDTPAETAGDAPGADPKPQTEYVSLLASRSGNTGYLQITQVARGSDDSLNVTRAGQPVGTAQPPDAAPETQDVAGASDARNESGGEAARGLIETLVAKGHVTLTDLDFESGAGTLGAGPHTALTTLAAWLGDDPARRLALVGHTDTVGGLEPNIDLSQQRAESVRDRLVEVHGVAPEQLEAHGIGYLAPVASNLTKEGRETNRRVEAVLLDAP